jgi:hypothetical protein
MKIAVVYNGIVRQVIDIDDLSKLPDFFTFEVDGEQVTKPRSEVKLLKVAVDVQAGDIYVPGKGIFRFAGK